MMISAIPVKESLTQTGSRRDDRDVAVAAREKTWIQRGNLFGLEIEHAVGCCLEVVEQFHALGGDGFGQIDFIELPGEVRRLAFAADHSAGNAKTSRFHA